MTDERFDGASVEGEGGMRLGTASGRVPDQFSDDRRLGALTGSSEVLQLEVHGGRHGNGRLDVGFMSLRVQLSPAISFLRAEMSGAA